MTPARTRPDRPRWRRLVAIAIAIVAVLLGGAVAVVPLLVDSPAVRRVVERKISALAGGEVRYDSIALRLFPLPRVEILGVTVRIPAAPTGRAAALEVELSLAALLAGTARPTAIRVKQPVVEVRIAPGAGDPLAAYRESLGPVVDALARNAQGMSVEIIGGTLDVVHAGRRVVSLSELAVQADVAADAIDVRVSCAADLWRAAEGRMRIAPGSLAGSVKLHVRGLQARGLLDAVRSDGALAVRPDAVDASLDAETDGRSAVRAALDASSPQLVLERGVRSLELGPVRIAADLARDAETLTVSLREFELGDLLRRATGSLRANADGSGPALELEVLALDLARLRERALGLAGDVDAVRAAAGIIRAGTLRSLTIASAGSTFSALADPRAIRAEVGLAGGELDFPELGIAVRAGRGRLVFTQGTLRGRELSGGIGRSSFRDGTLALELVPAVGLHDLRAAIDADLAEALAIARGALGRDGAAALADIESLHGRAAGSVAFERRGRRPSYRVELTRIRADGRYRGVPFPLAVRAGEVRYAHDSLRVRGLSGTVGRSRVTGASADVALDTNRTVRAASGDAVLELAELYPWLASLDRLRPVLTAVTGVTGTAAVHLARLSGPLMGPAELAFEAALNVSSPQLALERGARRLELGPVRIAANVARAAQTLTVSLRGLELGDVLPRATGSLRAHADGTGPALELEVPALDLARLCERALLLAGDVDAVRAAAGIIRAGTLRSLTIASAGRTWAALADPVTLRAAAGLTGGALDVPELGLAVRDGAGALAFADGALRGRALAGGIGRSSFRDGTLALELVPAIGLHDLRAAIDADLADALALARGALGRDGAAALADVESLRGRAVGHFAFERRGPQPGYRVELTRIRADGRYRGVPFPLAVSSGEMRYAHDSLRVRGLSGTIGRSRVTGASADVALDADRTVRAASGDAVLDLTELYPWLASLDRLRPALTAVTGVTGVAAVRLARLSGPLTSPAAVDFEAAVQPREIRASQTELPAPLRLAGGQANITRHALRFDQVEATLLDARVTASGRVEDYASAGRRLDLALADGAAGAETLDWLRTRWEIDPAKLPRPPVALAAGRLQWSAAEASERWAQGTLRLAGDARAEFDLAWGPERVHVRHFALKDADSDATGSLRWTPYRTDLAFRGHIDNRSIVRVMARPREVPARVQGNLRAEIDLTEPRRSTATGTLAGEGLDIPAIFATQVLQHWGLPVSIERVRVDATGDAAAIRDTVVNVAGQRIAVAGDIAIRPETFAVNLRVNADSIAADPLLRALPRGDPRRPPTRGAWDVPVEGRVAIAATSIAVGGRVVQSVTGTVHLAPRRVVVDLREARLCGLSVPLSATLTPGAAMVSGRIVARDAPLDSVTPCLLPGRDAVVTGRLDVDADYAASGPPGELAQRLRGSFRGTGRAGRIQHPRIGPRILALGPVAARLPADQATLAAVRGLDYTEIAVAATFDAGRARVQRFTLDGPTLGIGMTGEIDLDDGRLALRGVVAPFGEATAALRRVPFLGRLFGARIVGVPFGMTGDWRDPRVLPLGPEAIAGSFLDLLARTLNAPIELLNPLAGPQDRTP